MFPTATPVATPTPFGSFLPLRVDPFVGEVLPGQMLRGTQVEYVERRGDLFELRVNDLTSVRSVGDRFDWNGIVAPGVHGAFTLSVGNPIENRLRLSGSGDLTILYPAPQSRRIDLPAASTTEYAYFGNITTNMTVPEGQLIPGTNVTYEGQIDDETFRLRGDARQDLSQKLNNTFRWEGELRSGVLIRYTVRVEGASSSGLRLVGGAELWVAAPD